MLNMLDFAYNMLKVVKFCPAIHSFLQDMRNVSIHVEGMNGTCKNGISFHLYLLKQLSKGMYMFMSVCMCLVYTCMYNSVCM